jgi:hypothetical protein
MLIRRGAIWLFSTMALISLVTIAVSDENICPKQLNGAEVNDGKHQFQYKSWGWAKEARHIFCNCVRNNSDTHPLYVDWQGTNLSGFVAAQNVIYVYDSYSSNEHDEKTVPLFYGLGLKRVNAVTMFPTGVRRSNNSTFTRFAQIEEKQKYDSSSTADKRDNRETKTEGRIFIPLTGSNSPKDKEEIIRQVESGDLPLIPIRMRFTSRASNVGDKIRLEFVCEYVVESRDPRLSRNPIGIINADENLGKWFGGSLPYSMTGDWAGRGFQVYNQVYVSSGSSIVTRGGFMTFAGGNDGAPIGTIPVTYFTAD